MSLTALVKAKQVLSPNSLRIPLGCAQKRQAFGGNTTFLGTNIYLFSFHCYTTEKCRLPFTGTSLLCVVPGQQQEDFPDYTPRIPTTANELPEGAGHTFLMMKPLQSNPFRKETQLGEPAALQGKLCLGTHTQNAHKVMNAAATSQG